MKKIKRITSITEFKNKGKAETKIKSEENKKELPPLLNLKIKEKAETKNEVKEEVEK